MLRLLLLPGLASALLSACFWTGWGGDLTPDDDPELPATIAPDAVLFLDAPKRSWDPVTFPRVYSVPAIHDAQLRPHPTRGTRTTPEGPTQLLLLSTGFRTYGAVGTESPLLVQSEDLGASWTWHPMPELWFQNTPELATPVGAHAIGDDVIVMAKLWQSGAFGRWPYTQIIHAELPTLGWSTADGDYDRRIGSYDIHPTRDGVANYHFSLDPRSATLGSLSFSRYDVGTATMESTRESVEMRDCMPERWVTEDGELFVGFCLAGKPRPAVCRVSARPSESLLPVHECIGRYLWPAFLESPQRPHLSRGRGPVWLVEGAGRTWAVDVDAESRSLKVAALGLGSFAEGSWEPRGIHPRHAGLLAVQAPDEPHVRLFDLTPTGVEEVLLPPTPCIRETTCGARTWIEWLVPLGDDEFVAFYGVDTMPEQLGSSARLYLRRVKGQRVPVPPPLLPEPPGPLPGYPSAVEASQLEQLCATVAGCFSRRSEYPYDQDSYWCVHSLSQVHPSTAATFARLLSSRPGDCDALLDAWPSPYTRLPEIETCRVCNEKGDTAHCGTSSTVIACETAGGTCVEAPVAPGHSTIRAHCGIGACDASGPICVGNVAGTCVEGQLINAVDCSLTGLACDDGRCTSATKSPECDQGLRANSCQDGLAIYCYPSQLRYIDCKKLGFSGCSQASEFAMPYCLDE